MKKDDHFEENMVEDEVETKQYLTEKSAKPQGDRFSEFMFGTRNSRHDKDQEQTANNNEINYFTLIEQIDDIIGSIDNLKPVIKQFSPIVNFIKKKI